MSRTDLLFLHPTGVTQAVERVLRVAFGKNCVGSSPAISIFLYVAQAVERVLAVAFRKNCVGLSPTIGIFLYVAQAVERVLAVAFGTTQHSQKTDIHAPGGIWTHILSRRGAVVRPATGTG